MTPADIRALAARIWDEEWISRGARLIVHAVLNGLADRIERGEA